MEKQIPKIKAIIKPDNQISLCGEANIAGFQAAQLIEIVLLWAEKIIGNIPEDLILAGGELHFNYNYTISEVRIVGAVNSTTDENGYVNSSKYDNYKTRTFSPAKVESLSNDNNLPKYFIKISRVGISNQFEIDWYLPKLKIPKSEKSFVNVNLHSFLPHRIGSKLLLAENTEESLSAVAKILKKVPLNKFPDLLIKTYPKINHPVPATKTIRDNGFVFYNYDWKKTLEKTLHYFTASIDISEAAYKSFETDFLMKKDSFTKDIDTIKALYFLYSFRALNEFVELRMKQYPADVERSLKFADLLINELLIGKFLLHYKSKLVNKTALRSEHLKIFRKITENLTKDFFEIKPGNNIGWKKLEPTREQVNRRKKEESENLRQAILKTYSELLKKNELEADDRLTKTSVAKTLAITPKTLNSKLKFANIDFKELKNYAIKNYSR